MLRILHGEMRIYLKILTIIVIEGFSNCVDGSLCNNIGGAGPARFDQCMYDVQSLINTQTLGNDLNPSLWRFPIQQNQSPKKVRDLKSENNTSRNLLQHSIKITDISTTESIRKSLHVSCMSNILPALTLLRQKTNFSDDNIKKFQAHFDVFFQQWVPLWGEKSMSNCMHMYQS